MMRLFTLEDDLRPDDPSITLTCSNAPCGSSIRKGHKYGIAANTNLIYCASCANAPAEIEAPAVEPPAQRAKRAPSPRVARPSDERRPARERRPIGGQPLPPGQWSKLHDRCTNCGRNDARHRGGGLCERCRSAHSQRNRRPMSARGMVCIDCGGGEHPHKAQGRCVPCWKRDYNKRKWAEQRQAAAQQAPVRVDWRGVPFPQAVGQ